LYAPVHSHTRHMPRPPRSCWFDDRSNIWWLTTVQFPYLETCGVRKWGRTKEKGGAGYEASRGSVPRDGSKKYQAQKHWPRKHLESSVACNVSNAYKKTLNTNECTEFFSSVITLLHVSTLLGHLKGETFRCLYTRLHYTVKRECAIYCALRRVWSVGVCYNWWKKLFVHSLVFKVFCII
jgi:hypothetical protein